METLIRSQNRNGCVVHQARSGESREDAYQDGTSANKNLAHSAFSRHPTRQTGTRVAGCPPGAPTPQDATTCPEV